MKKTEKTKQQFIDEINVLKSIVSEQEQLIIVQKKEAEKIKKQEHLHQLALDTILDGYILTDTKGNIIDINPAYCKMIGYSRDELLKMNIREIEVEIPPDEIDRRVQKLKNHGNERFESKHKHKDGYILELDSSINIMFFDEIPMVAAFNRDVSDRKQIEKNLKENTERFDLVLKATKDGVYDWDLITNEIYYTPSWKSMLGYEDQELPNDFSVWETLISPDDVKKSWAMQNELINKERDRFEMEFKMKHKDGHWVDILSRANAVFDESGKAIRIVGTHIDISERRNAEKILLESENSYKGLFNSVSDAIYVLDGTGHFIDINQGAMNMYKHPKSFFIGNTPQVVSAPGKNDMQMVSKALMNAFAGEPQQFEFWGLRSNGEVFPKDVRLSKGCYFGQDVIFALARDISERIAVEEQLKSNEAQLRTLIETIPDLVWMKDPSGIFLNCNPRFELFFGASKFEIIGKTDYHFVDKELADFFRQKDNEAIVAGKSCINEEEVTFLSDGHREVLETIKTPLFDAEGIIIGVLGVARDITERKRAEKTLLDNEEKFRLLATNTSDIIWTTDLNFNFTYVNEAVFSFLGYTSEEIIGLNLREIITPEGLQKISELATIVLTDTYIKQNKNYIIEIQLIRKNTEIIDVEISANFITNRNEEIVGFQGRSIDITARKQIEEELRLHREHLQELVKERTSELEEKNTELERFNDLFVGREFRIKELRDELKKMEKQITRYKENLE